MGVVRGTPVFLGFAQMLRVAQEERGLNPCDPPWPHHF
jgi:hypothetical protein